MPDWIEKELRANFARASRAGRRAANTEPRAARVAYRAQKHALRIELTNGASITLPVRLIPSVKGARSEDIRAVEVLGQGGGLHWERLDVDLSVPGLVSSIFPGTAWLAELSHVGGRRTSAAKTVAARGAERRRDWLQLRRSIANGCTHRGRRRIHTDYLCLARFGRRGSLL
jgi:hypothetical protein